ncbi:DUF3037 domain-containing protein [Colwellia sp. UCD-KL20]|uniref:DUF3037 domain-containing protein n=1 Tax=Colwellia sp. UCD-KL20 TaxID=1917165 RepID=UPI0009709E24|nr:DUF3037 domain-containing protein [Colwellia sp. UCD-KL20]
MKISNNMYYYAVVRFMPFIETREFANVGVVLIEPKTGKFLFRLAPKRFGRVTNFFDDLDGQLYRNGIDVFAGELERVQEYFITHGLYGKRLVEQFNELTRRRESVIHFGDIGRVASTDAEQVLENLYQRFVVRDFVTKHYKEQQMVRTLKEKLTDVLPVKYKEKTFKAGVYDIKMPLVYNFKQGTSIIKPLALEQQTPLKAAVHGETWVNHMQRLIKYDIIKPENALFAIEKPKGKSDFIQVYDDIVGEIKDIGVQALNFENIDSVVNFAKANVENTDKIRH